MPPAPRFNHANQLSSDALVLNAVLLQWTHFDLHTHARVTAPLAH